MLLDFINRGSSPNDGTGDTLRDGANKINNNFQTLLDAHPSQTSDPPGGITGPDIISLFRPDNPNDRTEGGKDYGSTAAALLEFIASNLSSVTLPMISATLSLRGASSNPAVSLSRNSVRVFPVGQLAYMSGRITWSGLSGGSGALEIHLDDPSVAPASSWDVLGIRAQGITPSEISSSAEGLVLHGVEGHFRISVLRGALSPQTLAPSDLSSSGDMTISGWYQR